MPLVLVKQEIRVKGTVQGVGFRPAVYRLAIECELNGEVSNDTDGVLIRLCGRKEDIRRFLHRLPAKAPPLAKIDSIHALVVDGAWNYHDFRIGHSGHTNHSNQTQGRTEVVPDAAICQACVDEIHDPKQRRYGYPFTNCSHCGPRLSIIQGIPYDRPNTTMAAFPLCHACREEYNNPLDRRFHAQAIACHQCGPQLIIHQTGALTGTPAIQDSASQLQPQLQKINQALSEGKIVALKGLGGFHLCCDASNHTSVELLRQRKHRYAKPFALMSDQLDVIRHYCTLSALEQASLQSSTAPIVLLSTKTDKDNMANTLANTAAALSGAIAPGSRLLGWMLPYTPLHQLICKQFGKPLVMTSGNLSGEPQIIGNQEAIDKLSGIADLIVYHNRDIANRIDDSVVRCVSGRMRLVRRARGYAPRSIPLPPGFEASDQILAYGAELKSTFCLVKQGVAILSQHQGDLEDLSTIVDYEKNLTLYQTLFEFTPRYLAFDRHPEYISSKLAKSDANAIGRQLFSFEVQHHHAHIASAMAENQLPLAHPAVLGIAFDGLGYGADNTLWGGEFLLADYRSAQRVARLSPVAMPGGAQAVRQPWRNTVAQILNSMSWADFLSDYGDTFLAEWLRDKPIASLQAMMANQLNCPQASSVGRLFDAVAGALGLCAGQVQFEGQAAIELEMLVDQAAPAYPPYHFTIDSQSDRADNSAPLLNLNPATIWPELLRDLQNSVTKPIIAARFHAGLIEGVMRMVDRLAHDFTFDTVVLSGGCMQNTILLQGLEQAIQQRHLKCLTHALVPANDGGIALGQAVICAAGILHQSISNHSP